MADGQQALTHEVQAFLHVAVLFFEDGQPDFLLPIIHLEKPERRHAQRNQENHKRRPGRWSSQGIPLCVLATLTCPEGFAAPLVFAEGESTPGC